MKSLKNDFASDLITITATLAVAIGMTFHYWGQKTPLWILIPALYMVPLYKLLMMIYIILSKEDIKK